MNILKFSVTVLHTKRASYLASTTQLEPAGFSIAFYDYFIVNGALLGVAELLSMGGASREK